MSDIVVMRDIDIITSEIKTIKKYVEETAIYGFVEIGRRLVEAKELVGHGNWGKYLEDNFDKSQQWATNMMNIYREYDQAQQSMFPNFANSQVFGKIDITKHILLLGIPAEERQEFAEENHVESMTVKQLQAAIRERDASREEVNHQTARAEKAEAKAVEMGVKVSEIAAQLEIADGKLLAQDETIKQLRKLADVAEKKQTEAESKVDKLKQQLAKAKEGEKTAKDALQKAKEHPEIPETMMEEMRQQVAVDAAQQATAEIKKQLEAAQLAASEAEQRRVEAEQRVADAEKKIQLGSPDMVRVSTYLENVNDQFKKLLDAIKELAKSNPDAAAKLKENVKTKLIQSLQKAIDAV